MGSPATTAPGWAGDRVELEAHTDLRAAVREVLGAPDRLVRMEAGTAAAARVDTLAITGPRGVHIITAGDRVEVAWFPAGDLPLYLVGVAAAIGPWPDVLGSMVAWRPGQPVGRDVTVSEVVPAEGPTDGSAAGELEVLGRLRWLDDGATCRLALREARDEHGTWYVGGIEVTRSELAIRLAALVLPPGRVDQVLQDLRVGRDEERADARA